MPRSDSARNNRLLPPRLHPEGRCRAISKVRMQRRLRVIFAGWTCGSVKRSRLIQGPFGGTCHCRPRSLIMVPDWLRIDLHSSCHARHQAHAVRYPIDVDAHWHALRKPHPGEDWIYRGESRLIRLRVWHVNATSYAVDVATDELTVAQV